MPRTSTPTVPLASDGTSSRSSSPLRRSGPRRANAGSGCSSPWDSCGRRSMAWVSRPGGSSSPISAPRRASSSSAWCWHPANRSHSPWRGAGSGSSSRTNRRAISTCGWTDRSCPCACSSELRPGHTLNRSGIRCAEAKPRPALQRDPPATPGHARAFAADRASGRRGGACTCPPLSSPVACCAADRPGRPPRYGRPAGEGQKAPSVKPSASIPKAWSKRAR